MRLVKMRLRGPPSPEWSYRPQRNPIHLISPMRIYFASRMFFHGSKEEPLWICHESGFYLALPQAQEDA